MNEMKEMTKYTKFVTILKNKIRKAAFEYLVKKTRSKKINKIKDAGLHMASYLQPYSMVDSNG